MKVGNTRNDPFHIFCYDHFLGKLIFYLNIKNFAAIRKFKIFKAIIKFITFITLLAFIIFIKYLIFITFITLLAFIMFIKYLTFIKLKAHFGLKRVAESKIV